MRIAKGAQIATYEAAIAVIWTAMETAKAALALAEKPIDAFEKPGEDVLKPVRISASWLGEGFNREGLPATPDEYWSLLFPCHRDMRTNLNRHHILPQ